jgi:hypothetical protein
VAAGISLCILILLNFLFSCPTDSPRPSDNHHGSTTIKHAD